MNLKASHQFSPLRLFAHVNYYHFVSQLEILVVFNQSCYCPFIPYKELKIIVSFQQKGAEIGNTCNFSQKRGAEIGSSYDIFWVDVCGPNKLKISS